MLHSWYWVSPNHLQIIFVLLPVFAFWAFIPIAIAKVIYRKEAYAAVNIENRHSNDNNETINDAIVCLKRKLCLV